MPAGNSGAGQWTSGGVGGDRSESNDSADSSTIAPRFRTAQNESRDRYVVKLKDEEGYGHTIERHVGKRDDELLAAIEKERTTTRTAAVRVVKYLRAVGSFDSHESANDFVNRVLEANKDLVDAVAEGKSPEAKLERIFGYRTGKEAYLASGISTPVIRQTFGVRVIIIRDSKAEKGYRVLTAFPMNPRPLE